MRQAVQLAEHALRLTPPDRPERNDRLLALAAYLLVAGERQRVDLLVPELDVLPPGPARGRAYLLLADRGAIRSNEEGERYLERRRSDPELRAYVLAEISVNEAVIRVERIREAEAGTLEALSAARLSGPDAERCALHALA